MPKIAIPTTGVRKYTSAAEPKSAPVDDIAICIIMPQWLAENFASPKNIRLTEAEMAVRMEKIRLTVI